MKIIPFQKLASSLNIVFLLQLTVVGLIATGFVEREAALALLAVVLFFLIFSSLEDALCYTVRSIPFFVALPLTESFDSFNMWRVVIGVVFLKWVLQQDIRGWIKNFNAGKCWRENQFEFLAIIVLLLAVFSLIKATDLISGIKRIIYLSNIIMLYPVTKSVIQSNKSALKRVMKNIAVGILVITSVGYLQLATAFSWDFMRFVYFWAKKVQYGFYGEAWSSIVYHSNTWFAYLGGGGLRLRVFSTFPDSHSLPLYLLMGLISFLTITFWGLGGLSSLWKSLWKLNFHKLILFSCVPLILFVIILTGTRGIWVSAVFPIFIALGLFIWRKIPHKRILAFILSVLFLFLLLLPVASYFYSFPQFNPALEEEENEAFLSRLRSSISTSEVSNNARIEIWLKTLLSFQKAPLLGVGIGNFPVVLDQDVSLAKAGSSAHNLYLNVAAEIGFIGGILFALALFLLLANAFQVFIRSTDDKIRAFGLFALLFLVWVFGYSLTDAALFDERAFMMFTATSAMIMATYEKVTRNQ